MHLALRPDQNRTGRRRRKPAPGIRWAPYLALLGVITLALVVFVLLYIARLLGLEPEAFVVAVFAGLATIFVYGGFLGLIYLFYHRGEQARMVRALQVVDVDHMNGQAFERYVAQLLADQGYEVTHTGAPGDLGVDLVARNSLLKYAVQIKRQTDPVSRRAVSDAVAGMAQYHCNAAMVVTNNYFSPGAKALARSNKCVLVDRDRLARWIVDFQES